MADLSTSIKQVEAMLPTLSSQYYRLLLVVGPATSDQTRLLRELCQTHQLAYLSIDEALSERFQELDSKERALRVRRLLAEALDEQLGETIALDNIQPLFDPVLRQDPLACLQALSRNKTLVVAWTGAITDRLLTYGTPGHPDYRRYEHPAVLAISLS